jgi:hypothetical protein
LIEKTLKEDKNYKVIFGEISKYVEMICDLKDIKFSEDIEDLKTFYREKKEDWCLLDYLDDQI